MEDSPYRKKPLSQIQRSKKGRTVLSRETPYRIHSTFFLEGYGPYSSFLWLLCSRPQIRAENAQESSTLMRGLSWRSQQDTHPSARLMCGSNTKDHAFFPAGLCKIDIPIEEIPFTRSKREEGSVNCYNAFPGWHIEFVRPNTINKNRRTTLLFFRGQLVRKE